MGQRVLLIVQLGQAGAGVEERRATPGPGQWPGGLGRNMGTCWKDRPVAQGWALDSGAGSCFCFAELIRHLLPFLDSEK